MQYLLLNFADNLNKSSSKIDFFNLSLEEQFKSLQKRIPVENRTSSFNTFIEKLFPSGLVKTYYLSCPNLLRELKQSKSGITFLNNIVIRPSKTLEMCNYLPKNQNIILIGDIYEGQRLKMFLVKGLQLIDDKMSSPFDLVIKDCAACNCFERNNWTIRCDYENQSYFTPNNILDITQNCYTVENPVIVKNYYNLWHEYFKFRNYYLNEQSKRTISINNGVYLDSYAINKKEYYMDSLLYDDYVLDNHKEFLKGDMIVVDKKVGLAESFPLIRIDIIRNKKLLVEDCNAKGNKKISEEERKIRSLANDNIIITSIDPKSLDLFSTLINSGYELGERFKTIKFEILPNEQLNKVANQYKEKLKQSYEQINQKYNNIINKELNDHINNETKNRELENETKVNEYKQFLLSKLEQDVKENKDKQIKQLIEKEIQKLKKDEPKQKNESKKEYEERIINKINLKSFYIKRNENDIFNYENKLVKQLELALKAIRNEKEKELKNKYKEDIKNEENEQKRLNNEQLLAEQKQIIENETQVCFSIYFKINDGKDIKQKQKELISNCRYIVYDSRAEKAKLKRQEFALENFYSGNVKNPYLSTYLFSPEKVQQNIPVHVDKNWYLESLNDKQKEAVRKAVSSNGLFLLQGPPGTGKTQVIAEIVAHLVNEGKKVLISSETHKAIDNVFERLPKIAEIIPIRLILSKNNKESEYTPKYLVDNFYQNISTNMQKIVDKYNNFQKNKENFEENFEKLKLLKKKVEKEYLVYSKAKKKINELDNKAKTKNTLIRDLKEKIDINKTNIDKLRRTNRHIEKYDFALNLDIEEKIIAEFYEEITSVFKDKKIFIDEIDILIKNINSINEEQVKIEIEDLTSETKKAILNLKIENIKNKIKTLTDEIGDPLPGNEEACLDLRKQYRELKTEQDSSSGISDGLLNKIFKYEFLLKNSELVESLIEEKKNQIKVLKNKFNFLINEKIYNIEVKINDIQTEILRLTNEIKKINDDIIEIEDNYEIEEIRANKQKLENKIDEFFKEFNIMVPYKSVDDALIIIKNTYEDLVKNYDIREAENKEKIPMYKKISKFLSQYDVVEADRRLYTKSLFESANVIGITCTSSDRFSSANNDELSEYNLEDIDIKNVGIDVVIIDEVSKSSFIDLLIPILYGKTIILVGDHRQLPPMYEFSKLRDEQFENLDENIINPIINKKFTKMYEECFFKTLFEKAHDEYKTMLVQQYRSHEDIMKVFNHFYQKQLRLGFDGQNNLKKHNIEISSNGRKIIQPDKHIYFINCNKFETRDQDSTSIYNIGEAEVVVELLKKLKIYFRNNPQIKPLSIGVICTYGDQAKKIKELMKSEKITTNDFKHSQEKLIVSTVDDFQGDERDIIILSTVRNPQDEAKSNPGFILAYQRINVALSRGRCLLFVVGNRKYLEKRGVIDLPDVFGREEYNQRNFRVYEEIIDTIETYGKILDDIDVVESKEGIING